MKYSCKLILVLLFALAITQNVFAQNFFLDMGASVNLPIFAHEETVTKYWSINQNNTEVVESSTDGPFSLGKGQQYYVGLGVHLSKSIALKLKGSYFQNTDHPEATYTAVYGSGDSDNIRIQSNGKVLSLMPMLNFQTTGTSELQGFVGVGLPIAKPTYEQEEFNEFLGGVSQYFKRTYDSRWILGMGMELGLGYQLNRNLMIQVSFQTTILNFRPKKSEVVIYTVNGTDKLADLNTYHREKEYGGTTIIHDLTNSDPLGLNPSSNRPEARPIFVVPYSSMAFQLGVKYQFGKEK